MSQTVYIDGDVLPYKIGFATQQTLYHLESEGPLSGAFLTTRSKRTVNKYLKRCPDIIVSEKFFVEDDFKVIETLKASIRSIVQGSKCPLFKVCLSGNSNFRESIATIKPYKGNRTGSEKPFHFNLIREWLLEKPYTIVSDNEEADDVISKALMEGHVGASPDKDLNNSPGTHYNFVKNIIYEVTEEEAMRNFYTQMLTGDTADNIPGIIGVGPVTAKKMLQSCNTPKEYEEVILGEYSKVYESPRDAMIEVGRLLWMRREDNELWELSI